MKNVDKQKDITFVIANVVSAVVGNFEMNSLLNQIIKTTMNTLHAEVCSIFLEDKEKDIGVLKCVAGSGFAKGIVNTAEYKIGEGFTGTVAQTGDEYNIKSRDELENLVVDGKKVWKGRFDHKQWPSEESEFRNCLALPLKIKEQIFGVFKVENKKEILGNHFTNNDMSVFKTIANVIALTIENARLHTQIEDQLKMFTLLTAHKINNQVTNYDGIEKHLRFEGESETTDNNKILELARRMSSTTHHLKAHIEELNCYGKPIKLQKVLSDINLIIHDEVWLLRPPLTIQFEKTLDGSIPKFYFDPLRISSSIKELLKNALTAIQQIRPSGLICIKTCVINEDRGNKKFRQYLLLVVADDGPGIENESLIFTPYYTTSQSKGMGLGLPTVKQNIEAHGGTIVHIKNNGGGARFEITLPIQVKR